MHNQCAEESETLILCTGSAGRQCKVQVVAALVIRDAVGDAISRQQAAVKPGPWPGRRAAGEALLRLLSSLEPFTFTGVMIGERLRQFRLRQFPISVAVPPAVVCGEG